MKPFPYVMVCLEKDVGTPTLFNNKGGCKTVGSYSGTTELYWQSKSSKLEVCSCRPRLTL